MFPWLCNVYMNVVMKGENEDGKGENGDYLASCMQMD